MPRIGLFASILLLVLVEAGAARGQGFTPAEALRRMQTPTDLRVRLVASEPLVRQPVAITFDDRGRLWCIQYLQYPTPAGLKAVEVDRYLRTVYDRLPDPPPRGPKGADRITILEDSDGDGVMDSAKDFVGGLNLATGIAHGYSGVFILQSPYLLFYPDRNHDDAPDGDPEVLLTGFGMEDAHALANSLTWGPDGWLYGAQGSTVTANIRGIQFQQGIWRYHPRTKRFELFAEGGGNTWGLDFDRNGNLLAGTNYGGVAMLHQVQGGYYVKGFEKHGALHNPHAYGYFEHVPYSGFVGGHVTSGGVVYQGGALPKRYHDQYLAANLLSNALHWHRIESLGSSFSNRRGGDLVQGNDTWFRPIDCEVGPDGGLYVADWYDKRANHVDPKDDWDRSNGRVYCLESAAAPSRMPSFDMAGLSSERLARYYNHPNAWFERVARRLLAERRDPAVLPLLRRIVFEKPGDPAVLKAFWMLAVSADLAESDALRCLAHANAGIRTWTIRLLGDENQISGGLEPRLQAMAETESNVLVRSQLASTAKRLPAAQSLPIVARLLLHDEDRGDPHIPLLLWWALESKAASDRSAVLDLFREPRLWSAAIVQETILPRIARRYAAEADDAGFAACARLLAAAPNRIAADKLIDGMDAGLEGRRFNRVPAVLEQPLKLLRGNGRPNTTLVRLGMRLGDSETLDFALEQLVDAKAPLQSRIALIETLGQLAPPRALSILLFLSQPVGEKPLRAASLAALRKYNDPRVFQAALLLLPTAAGEERKRCLDLLCGKPAAALALLQAVDAGRISPVDLATDSLQQILLHRDPQLNALIEKHWGKIQPQTTGEKRARIHGIEVSLKLAKGDRERGRAVFKQHCATCHTLFGDGNRVGPELSGADRRDLNFLLTSIVDPSAVIRKEYLNHTIQTTDGQVLTGLIAESTPTTVVVLDAKNQRTTLARSDVETIKVSAVSLMPEKLLDALDAQQVRDLVAYLQSDLGPSGKSPRQSAAK